MNINVSLFGYTINLDLRSSEQKAFDDLNLKGTFDNMADNFANNFRQGMHDASMRKLESLTLPDSLRAQILAEIGDRLVFSIVVLPHLYPANATLKDTANMTVTFQDEGDQLNYLIPKQA